MQSPESAAQDSSSLGAIADGLAWWIPQGEKEALFAQRYGWLTRVNGGGFRDSADPGSLLNCALTAIATHWTVVEKDQGLLAQDGLFAAPPVAREVVSNGGLPLQDLVNHANEHRPAGGAPRVLTEVADIDTIAAAMEQAGPGAHGFVVVDAGGGRGHVFNAMHDQDGVLFLDGQTGKPAVLPGPGVEVLFIAVGPVEVGPVGTPIRPGTLDVGASASQAPGQPAQLVLTGTYIRQGNANGAVTGRAGALLYTSDLESCVAVCGSNGSQSFMVHSDSLAMGKSVIPLIAGIRKLVFIGTGSGWTISLIGGSIASTSAYLRSPANLPDATFHHLGEADAAYIIETGYVATTKRQLARAFGFTDLSITSPARTWMVSGAATVGGSLWDLESGDKAEASTPADDGSPPGSPELGAVAAQADRHGPLRRAHFSIDSKGIAWASPHLSAYDADGNPIPQDQQACVSVTVITLTWSIEEGNV